MEKLKEVESQLKEWMANLTPERLAKYLEETNREIMRWRMQGS